MSADKIEKPVMFYSTNFRSPRATFREALLKGLAPDGGLYMPERIPSLSVREIENFQYKKYYEVAASVLERFIAGEVSSADLLELAEDAYNFDLPLEKVSDRKYIMRLDRGPTASFKDFAARMMARLMNHFLKKEMRKILILTATSGDTGSAIANAFYGLDNIDTVVLFPEKEITPRQRKQMTTLGANVRVIAIDGKFDDCQALVKRAFTDPSLEKLGLSSANSINIGRLIPQAVYYFYAYSRLHEKSGEEIIFSVPCGNFGNLMGGLIAKRMGLSVKRFVVATNENDEVPKYLNSGIYNIVTPSRSCISSAMNVGHPSNISRIVALYDGVMNEKGAISKPPDLEKMRNDLYAISINEDETKRTIADAYKKYGILLEPHGAVGMAGLIRYLEQAKEEQDQLCVSLETAHPAKFPDQLREILSIDPDLPPALAAVESKDEDYIKKPDDYGEFRDYLNKNYRSL